MGVVAFPPTTAEAARLLSVSGITTSCIRGRVGLWTHSVAVSNPPEHPEFWTVAEVAERLRVDPRTVRRLVEAGELSAVQFGPKSLRIVDRSIDNLIARKAA